jgi:hypothetical protein
MTLSGRLSSPFANSAGIAASTRSNVHVVPYSSGASLSIWLRSLLLRTATVRIRFFLRQAQASGPNRFVNRVCHHVNLFRSVAGGRFEPALPIEDAWPTDRQNTLTSFSMRPSRVKIERRNSE